MVCQSEIAIIYMKNGLTKSVHYGKLSLVGPTTSGLNTGTKANYLTMKQSQSGIGQLATIVRVIPMAILAVPYQWPYQLPYQWLIIPWWSVVELGGGACPFPTGRRVKETPGIKRHLQSADEN